MSYTLDAQIYKRHTHACIRTCTQPTQTPDTHLHAHQPVCNSCQQASCLPVSPSVHGLESPLTTYTYINTQIYTHRAVFVKLPLGASLPALCQGVWQEIIWRVSYTHGKMRSESWRKKKWIPGHANGQADILTVLMKRRSEVLRDARV